MDLEVEAELETAGPLVPAPGHSYMISVSRYRVLRVVHGQYSHEWLLVGHENRDMAAPDFKPGARERRELSRAFPEHSHQVNPFAAEQPSLPVYYCLSSRP